MMKERRVDLLCVQETRWKGEKAKTVQGYKLWYTGSVSGRNGVGILASEAQPKPKPKNKP